MTAPDTKPSPRHRLVGGVGHDCKATPLSSAGGTTTWAWLVDDVPDMAPRRWVGSHRVAAHWPTHVHPS